MGATCRNCGKEWDRDPALEVACPSCSAEVGQHCKRPSGHKCRIHTDRDQRALEEVDDYSTCPAAATLRQPKQSTSDEAHPHATTQQTTLPQ